MVEDCPAASKPTPQMYLADLPKTSVFCVAVVGVFMSVIVAEREGEAGMDRSNRPRSSYSLCFVCSRHHVSATREDSRTSRTHHSHMHAHTYLHTRTSSHLPANASCARSSPISPQTHLPALSRERQARGLLLSTRAQATLCVLVFVCVCWVGGG